MHPVFGLCYHDTQSYAFFKNAVLIPFSIFFGGHRKYTCTSEGVSEEGDDGSF